MVRRIKRSAFLAALAISGVLTYGNVVCAWSTDLITARKDVESAEKKRVQLEEERKELLEDYGEDHESVKAIEEEILELAKEYTSLLTKAHQQVVREIKARDEETARNLDKTVTELEDQKRQLEIWLKDYPANVIVPKTYAEAWRTFWRVTEDAVQGYADDWTSFLVGKEGGDLRVICIGGALFRMRWCPPGTFVMGSPKRERGRFEDEVLHKVTLSHGFWILETEVTKSMWDSVMAQKISLFQDDANLLKDDADLPVEDVWWERCKQFIAKLNEIGYAPAGYRFSLPTEAQWEYACRAGTRTPFSWGSSLNGDKANCDGREPYGTKTKGKFLEKTTPVGSYTANPWGLFDMHGNVAEWCEDEYDVYPSGAATDPCFSSSSSPPDNQLYVIRGGSWYDVPENCRSARRYALDYYSIEDTVGFRFVLAPHAGEKLETPEEE